jgi:C1A family cysteine protease
MPDLLIRRIRSVQNSTATGYGPLFLPVSGGFGSLGPLIPGSVGPLIPGSIGQLIPGSICPIIPGSVGPLVPGSIGPIIPGCIDPTVPGAASVARFPVAMGWLPDVPDGRDRTLDYIVKNKVQLKGKLYHLKPRVKSTPFNNHLKLASSFELDPDLLPPIQNQGALESCTAHAVSGLLEYLQRRAGADFTMLSRLFLYKATRDFEGVSGDSGAYIRDTIKAAGLFGIPPEDRFPYVADNVNVEPEAFLYAYAANYKALNYVRLDSDIKPTTTIENTKRVLMHGLPVALGFTVYSNMTTAADIPMPGDQDKPLGGHAVMAVGYDDQRKVNGKKVASIKIRNSWGPQWGDRGYGWLPFDYITNMLACDFWTCFQTEWPK